MEWRDIPGWEGLYEASEIGEIRSVRRLIERPTPKRPDRLSMQHYGGKVLSPKTNRNGYREVTLYRDNRGRTVGVHRLVAMAFHPVPLPDVNHKDGDKTHNSASNLEWCTRGDNHTHAYRVLGRIVPISGKQSRHFLDRLIEVSS